FELRVPVGVTDAALGGGVPVDVGVRARGGGARPADAVHRTRPGGADRQGVPHRGERAGRRHGRPFAVPRRADRGPVAGRTRGHLKGSTMTEPGAVGLIGSGWRAEFFLRLAAALPDRFRVSGVVSRSRGAEVTAKWGVPAF